MAQNKTSETKDIRISDGYEVQTYSYDDLMSEVNQMEDNSRWISGIPSKDLVINPIPDVFSVPEVVENTKMSQDLVLDTANGTGLYVTLPDGANLCVRETGRVTLLERACLFGSALGKECAEDLSKTLNMALKVSTGPSLLLVRYGKASAFHSDAGSGYRFIPISQLLKITEAELNEKFGTPVFYEGYNSHSYTKAVWTTPDVQEELILSYKNVLEKSQVMSRWEVNDLMPAVRLTTSDTATAAVVLQPLFMTQRGSFIRLVDGIRIKHIRAPEGKADGLELFEQMVQEELFARFKAGAESVQALVNTELYHPENVVVGICNKMRIPKKYGDSAREQVERFMVSAGCLTAYDVYMALSEAISFAAANGLSEQSFLNMEEKLFSLLNPAFDWQAMDVSGIVAWGNAAA